MKLSYVALCGFRGYRRAARIDFAEGFTVIDGRNGVGKSTLFDAVEYALTGTIDKYNGAKADRETVDDYVWWTGEGSDALTDRYVEVGFVNAEGAAFSVKRTAFQAPAPDTRQAAIAGLTVESIAPDNPLEQLCAVAIIRDEHIAALSLDLKETDRYTLLREALGATDSDTWVERGKALLDATKKAVEGAEAEVKAMARVRDTAVQSIDEARAAILSDDVVEGAAARLRTLTSSALAADELIGPARERISELRGRVESLGKLAARWDQAEAARSRISELEPVLESARANRAEAAGAVEALQTTDAAPSSDLAEQARRLAELVALGRQVGLREGGCPLCGCKLEELALLAGMDAVGAAARALNELAVESANRERALRGAKARLAASETSFASAERELSEVRESVNAFDAERSRANLGVDATRSDLEARTVSLRVTIEGASSDLRIVETVQFNTVLERAEKRAAEAEERVNRAERAAGQARKAAATAKALYDAARRAVSETLDQRLGRVLPLASELYRRLNPHPVWTELDFSIRGDVRRFMTLQVGEKHDSRYSNPQFVFSSGQRRATGLAFLLSINLSLAWSRWKTILLDDPVQHVDDFRAIHLAEVIGQLVREGRQIVCAVEDAALADLLCRRLPNDRLGQAKRVTLGLEPDGSSSVAHQRGIPPLPRYTLLRDPNERMAG